MSHQWTLAEWMAAALPWTDFHVQYPAITSAQWRYARQWQRNHPDRLVSRDWVLRGPETPSERQVARQLAYLAVAARQQHAKPSGDVILNGLRNWWRETRGVL